MGMVTKLSTKWNLLKNLLFPQTAKSSGKIVYTPFISLRLNNTLNEFNRHRLEGADVGVFMVSYNAGDRKKLPTPT